MKCRDFERLINEQLDAREAASPEVERALEGHGEVCPSCRATALRYQMLRQAIAALRPPSPPADFAERFPNPRKQSALDAESEVVATAPAFPRLVKFWPSLLYVAAAASLLLAVWSGVHSSRPARPALPRVGSASAKLTPDPLADALAQATAATWDLARTTSAPAALVGLEILDADDPTETTESRVPPVEDDPASEVLQGVGARVDEEVRPLSGTARHAFDFLLGPAPTRPEASPHPTGGV